jgi:hypothetical protein
MARLGKLEAVQIGLVLLVLWGVSTQLPLHEQVSFIVAGIFGLVTFIVVDGIGALMEQNQENTVARTGFAAFLYLEVLDASFSFDGVIGAFAISNQLIVIALGLGIGSMFVRSLTIMLVENGTLTEYRYLEHGAFYAIIALSIVMFLQAFLPDGSIPDWFTGLVGAALIGSAFLSSWRYNNNNPPEPLS